jgi:hypothetical protein
MIYVPFEVIDIHYINTDEHFIVATGFLNKTLTFERFYYIDHNWMKNQFILTEKSNCDIDQFIKQHFTLHYDHPYNITKFMLLKDIVKQFLINDLLQVIVDLSD